MELSGIQAADEDDLFEIRTAGEWVDAAPATRPKMLLGDLWREGEIAVMFGESAVGKSIFAVQIADAIARGCEITPFENTLPAQKVLYLDLGRTGEQFGTRYTSEPKSETKTETQGPVKPKSETKNGTHRASKQKSETRTGTQTRYSFPDNLIRPVLKLSVHLPPSKLAPLIERTGAKVLIIDNIAYLQKNQIPRETAVVMRELRRLRDRYGLSILLLMNTTRQIRQRGITASDIPCANAVLSFADNVFAIGRSGSRSAVRYIKHIKPGQEDLTFGAPHVPYFDIRTANGNFPSFSHFGYANEMSVLAHDNDDWEWDQIRHIKELSDAGNSIRAIAEHLRMSSTSVHRRLQMAIAAPPLPVQPIPIPATPQKQFYTFEKCIVEECYGCWLCHGRAAHRKFKVQGNIEGHGDCPDDCDICGPRRYKPDDTVTDQTLRTLSNDHYRDLREWLLDNKSGDRPEYPNARRYGVYEACWLPGSEYWSEEQLLIYRKWHTTAWQTHAPPPAFALVRRE